MKNELNNPHDKYFRAVLSNVEIAKDFVKAFVPKEVIDALEMEYFEQVTDSFIDQDLQSSISDIIYRTRFKDMEQDVFVSLLFEHKSYCDVETIFQLHRYLPNIWEHQVRQGAKRPLVIPLVIYHGKGKWKKKGLDDFFSLPNEYFRQFLPIFDYILVDLSEYSEEEILGMHINAMVVNMAMALKFGRNNEYLIRHFDRIVHRSLEYVDYQLGKNFLEVTFVYLISINQISDKNWDTMIEKLPKPVKSKAMTMYDRLIKKGIRKGEEIGIRKGEEIGIRKGEEIGIRKGEAQTFQVIKMYKKNHTPQAIASELGISLELVNRIIKEFEDLMS